MWVPFNDAYDLLEEGDRLRFSVDEPDVFETCDSRHQYIHVHKGTTCSLVMDMFMEHRFDRLCTVLLVHNGIGFNWTTFRQYLEVWVDGGSQ